MYTKSEIKHLKYQTGSYISLTISHVVRGTGKGVFSNFALGVEIGATSSKSNFAVVIKVENTLSLQFFISSSTYVSLRNFCTLRRHIHEYSL